MSYFTLAHYYAPGKLGKAVQREHRCALQAGKNCPTQALRQRQAGGASCTSRKKLELRVITAWLLATVAALDPNCSPNKEMSLFTKIIRKEIPSCKVGAGELWYAFLDINPRRAGHTLVVPVEEKQRLAELSAESRAALMEGCLLYTSPSPRDS